MKTDRKWFRHDRFGMFIHWGLYAIPAVHLWDLNVTAEPDDSFTKGLAAWKAKVSAPEIATTSYTPSAVPDGTVTVDVQGVKPLPHTPLITWTGTARLRGTTEFVPADPASKMAFRLDTANRRLVVAPPTGTMMISQSNTVMMTTPFPENKV